MRKKAAEKNKKETTEEEHQRILAEVLASRDDLKKSINPLPFYLIGLLLIMILILWVIPENSFPARAQLSTIPSIASSLPATLTIPERPTSKNINEYINYNDPAIKMIAAKIVTQACSRNDPACYANAIFHYTKQINYVNDPITEYYETPQETLLAGAADCDGHAILLASLLRSVGILTEFSYEVPRHVMVKAWLPENHLFSKKFTYEWVTYDATCKTCKPGEYRPS
jgi:transglutaminase-like putative cysteine protease